MSDKKNIPQKGQGEPVSKGQLNDSRIPDFKFTPPPPPPTTKTSETPKDSSKK